MCVESDARPGSIVARTPPSAFGEEDQWNLESLSQFKHAILFVVIPSPLRPSKHCVIIGDNHSSGAVRREILSIHRANACNESVGRGVFSEFFVGEALVLTGDDQRAVLLEGSFIYELSDVFSGHSKSAAVPFGYGLWPVFIECVRVPGVGLFKVWSDVIQIDCVLGLKNRVTHVGFLNEYQGMALHDDVVGRDVDFLDYPWSVGLDYMLHFHGFHNQNFLPDTYLIAFADRDLDDGSLDGSGHPHRSVRPAQIRRVIFGDLFGSLGAFDLTVVIKKRQRIRGVHHNRRSACQGACLLSRTVCDQSLGAFDPSFGASRRVDLR